MLTNICYTQWVGPIELNTTIQLKAWRFFFCIRLGSLLPQFNAIFRFQSSPSPFGDGKELLKTTLKFSLFMSQSVNDVISYARQIGITKSFLGINIILHGSTFKIHIPVDSAKRWQQLFCNLLTAAFCEHPWPAAGRFVLRDQGASWVSTPRAGPTALCILAFALLIHQAN